MARILICENVPSLNKGEMAILEGMRESLRELGKLELVMFSARPDIDAPRYSSLTQVIDPGKSWVFSRGLSASWAAAVGR